ncbi:MAG: hypothetical protein WBN75_15620 [Verrucomicrobiia bacterium]
MNTNLSSGKFDPGAPASRGRATAKLAGETPAHPDTNPQPAAANRNFSSP